MNLEELRSVQSTERRKDSLQELRDSFYRDVAGYIEQLKRERERAAEAAEDPFSSPEVRRLTDEIETAEEVAEAVYERRVGKVVKLASFAAADMPVDEEGMTAEETALFDDLVARIQRNKGQVLDTLQGRHDDPSEGGDAGGAPGTAGEGPPAEPAGETRGADRPDRTAEGSTAADGRPGGAGEGSRERPGPPQSGEATGDQTGDGDRTGEADPTGDGEPPTAGGSDVLSDAMGGAAGGGDDSTGAGGSGGAGDPSDGTTGGSPGADDSGAGDGHGEPDPVPVEPDPAPPGETGGPASGATEGSDAGAPAPGAGRDGSGAGTEKESGAGTARDRGSGTAGEPATDRTTVRITRDVGAILGVDDREYELASEDVVSLPAANAEPLIERDAAERID